MATISDAINKIKAANYGGYLRTAMVDALEAIDERIDGPGVIYDLKGTVPTYDDLPIGVSTGDIYTVTALDKSFVWTGTEWTDWCWWDK